MANEYTVLKGDELTRVADTGELEKYRRYQLRTKGKMIISVDLDEEDWPPEKANPIFTAAAREADQVLALKG